jgi:hypothetical protein
LLRHQKKLGLNLGYNDKTIKVMARAAGCGGEKRSPGQWQRVKRARSTGPFGGHSGKGYVMRASYLARGLVGFLVMAAPVAALAGGDVKLQEIDYESWTEQEFGDPLPLGGPVIRVFSESGDRFKFIGHTDEPVRFLGLLSGSCPGAEEIDSLEFEVSEQKVPVSHPDNRGAWFSRIGVVELSRTEPKGFHAVRECNAKLKVLAERTGRTRRELVAEGFGIRFRNWIEGRAILTCSGRNNSHSDTSRLDIWVQCGGKREASELATPATSPVPEKLTPFVTDLTVAVDRPSYVGKCPVALQFTGSITTSRAGSVSYRSIADDGRASAISTLRFAAAGTQTINTWDETLGEPISSAEPAGGPEYEGPEYTGWRRLEIVDPEGFARSSPAGFSVTCQE